MGRILTIAASWLKGLLPCGVAIYFAATAALLVEFNWNLVLFFVIIGLFVDLLVKINNRISLYLSLVCLSGLLLLVYYIIRFHLMPSEVTCLPLDICIRTKYFNSLPAGQISSAAVLKAGIVDVLKLLSIGVLCFLGIARIAYKNIILPPMPAEHREPRLAMGCLVLLTALPIFGMTRLPSGRSYWPIDWSHVRDLSDVYFTYLVFPGGIGYLISLTACMIAVMISMDEESFFTRP